MPHCFVGQKWSQRVPEGSWRKEVLFCWKAPTNALLNTWAHSLLGNFPIFVRETFNERFLSNVNTYGSTNSCRWRLSKWKPDRSRSCSSTKAQNSQTRRCFHHLVSGWLKNWLCWFKKKQLADGFIRTTSAPLLCTVLLWLFISFKWAKPSFQTHRVLPIICDQVDRSYDP